MVHRAAANDILMAAPHVTFYEGHVINKYQAVGGGSNSIYLLGASNDTKMHAQSLYSLLPLSFDLYASSSSRYKYRTLMDILDILMGISGLSFSVPTISSGSQISSTQSESQPSSSFSSHQLVSSSMHSSSKSQSSSSSNQHYSSFSSSSSSVTHSSSKSKNSSKCRRSSSSNQHSSSSSITDSSSKSNHSSMSRRASSSNQRSSSVTNNSPSSKSKKSSKSRRSSSSTHRPSSSASKPPRPTKQGSPHSSSKKEEDTTGNRKKQIKIPAHLHEHRLLTLTAAGTLFTCDGCKEQGCGLSYRCEKEDCSSYVLHRECAKAVLKSKEPVSHPFFEGIKFKFLEEPTGRPWICSACRMDVKGFVYHHREPSKDLYNTGYGLHPYCFKLKESISHEEEESGEKITIKLQRDVPKTCDQCNRHKVKGDTRVGGWSYVTSDGKDCYHVSCFKKLILETLQKVNFSVDGKKVKVASKSNSSSIELKTVLEKLVTKIATTVLKLLFSLIIGGGHPIALLPAVVEPLFSS
ncbi:hypothetical protein PIB30_002835 [Stylosanthes scabra]|uniref:DC1 domain-containing protein n=1 Tax=Stylosanthes scabra TaxID=79078 RepID=A0ABU6T4W9_9FABA|nr:hypothetical protein [Stylosanthes scabra]